MAVARHHRLFAIQEPDPRSQGHHDAATTSTVRVDSRCRQLVPLPETTQRDAQGYRLVQQADGTAAIRTGDVPQAP